MSGKKAGPPVDTPVSGIALTDTEAMNLIAREMSGEEWNADTCDVIAAYVRGTGREIADTPGAATNSERAARAKKAVAAYVDLAGGGYDLSSINGIGEAISDLLADLRHRCAELDLDYDVLDGLAAANYRAEEV
jgi:hypothetical protein